jgi:hypothetical protein
MRRYSSFTARAVQHVQAERSIAVKRAAEAAAAAVSRTDNSARAYEIVRSQARADEWFRCAAGRSDSERVRACAAL